MDRESAEHAAEVLKAVAQPVKLQIVKPPAHGEMCVGDIVQALGEKAGNVFFCRRKTDFAKVIIR